MSRLPEPGGDDGTWGAILNDFLAVAHLPDGTIRTSALPAPQVSAGSITPDKLSETYVQDSLVGQVNGIATLNSTGVVPLTQLGSGTASSSAYLRGDSTWASPPVTSVAGKTGAVTLTSGDVGLGNVDNTSDANKPVSTAQQTALNGKTDTATTTALDGRVTALESPNIFNLADTLTIATDSTAGEHFRVSVTDDRTLGIPANPTDGMHRIWEITASGGDRLITLTTGSAGSFELMTGISPSVLIPASKVLFIGAIYSAPRDRWTVLARRTTV